MWAHSTVDGILASHPATPGSIPGAPKNFSESLMLLRLIDGAAAQRSGQQTLNNIDRTHLALWLVASLYYKRPVKVWPNKLPTQFNPRLPMIKFTRNKTEDLLHRCQRNFQLPRTLEVYRQSSASQFEKQLHYFEFIQNREKTFFNFHKIPESFRLSNPFLQFTLNLFPS